MAADGSFAPRRFVLPAFSLLWLVMLWMSLFHGPVAGRLAGALATGRRENGEAMPPDIDEARRVASAVAVALVAIESDRIREENVALRQRAGVQAV